MKTNSEVLKKHIFLTAAGVTLQMLGSTCLFAATLVAAKEINAQVKQLLIQQLSK